MNQRRDIARKHRLALLTTALVLVLCASISYLLLIPKPDALSKLLRQRGYPATLTELNAWYPAVPDHENAALIYTNALAHLTNRAGTASNFFSRTWLPAIGGRFTPEEKADLAGVLEANRDALRLMDTAASLERSRYPLDLTEGYTLSLPHLAQSRQAVLMLASEALLHAGDGDADLTSRSLLTAGRLAESVANEPILVSQKVRTMNWGVLLARVECALNLAAFSETQLAALQQQIQDAERPNAALRGWVTEWVAGKTLFEDRNIMDSALVAQSFIAPKSSGAQLGRMSPAARSGFVGLWRAAGQQERDRAFFMDYVQRRVGAMELSYPERFKVMERLSTITNAPDRLCVFSQMLFAARTFLDFNDAEHCARVRVTAAALGVERFRIAHGGSLPVSLADLAPNWVEHVPLDPFDGEPLRYRKHGPNYVVYSVGSDLKDNGGVDWDKNTVKSPGDISVLVKH